MSKRRAQTLASKHRALKDNPKSARQRKTKCPVINCEKTLIRLDKHLINFHRFQRESEEYIRYDKKFLLNEHSLSNQW